MEQCVFLSCKLPLFAQLYDEVWSVQTSYNTLHSFWLRSYLYYPLLSGRDEKHGDCKRLFSYC